MRSFALFARAGACVDARIICPPAIRVNAVHRGLVADLRRLGATRTAMTSGGVAKRLEVAFNDTVFRRAVEQRKLRVGETKALRRAIRAGCISQLRDPRTVWAAYAYYCEHALVPEIVLASPLFDAVDVVSEVAVVLNIFPGTHVPRRAGREIRDAFAGLPALGSRRYQRFLMRGDGTLRPISTWRGSGTMTWDGVMSRWFAHPALSLEEAERFIPELQGRLGDAYDFALVHAVTSL